LIPPSKKNTNIINGIKIKLKVAETFIAVISLASLIMTQFEYELEYYPKYYKKCAKDEDCSYNGMPVRIIASLMCACLTMMTIYVSYQSYILKREQKKIINSNWINLFYKFIYDVVQLVFLEVTISKECVSSYS